MSTPSMLSCGQPGQRKDFHGLLQARKQMAGDRSLAPPRSGGIALKDAGDEDGRADVGFPGEFLTW